MATRTTQISSTTEVSHATSALFTTSVAALFLMATGWGWNAGNFVQPANTNWGAAADILHVLPLAVLVPLSLRFIAAAVERSGARGARNGITGVAVFSIVGCAVMVVLGLVNPDPNSVGVHTFEDWMPVIVLNAGTLLWLGTLVFARRGARA